MRVSKAHFFLCFSDLKRGGLRGGETPHLAILANLFLSLVIVAKQDEVEFRCTSSSDAFVPLLFLKSHRNKEHSETRNIQPLVETLGNVGKMRNHVFSAS